MLSGGGWGSSNFSAPQPSPRAFVSLAVYITKGISIYIWLIKV